MGGTSGRKRLGAWYTPHELVTTIVDEVVDEDFVRARRGRPLRVLDPACGDGRFLAAVVGRVEAFGGECELAGIDLDPAAVAAARATIGSAEIVHGDALVHDFSGRRFDLVIGNPPFLSQLAAATTRGGANARSGGPYADAAVEFLALGAEVVEPAGGRVAFVLPQSLLAARDAGPLRASFDERAALIWSWWTGELVFDAQVLTCALAFEFGEAANRGGSRPTSPGNWSHVVTSRRDVPPLPALQTRGTLADRATLNANFRDEYYGMVPAVGDHQDGPRLITSGLIDPGRTRWGERSVTFAKRRFAAPRIDLDALDPKMRRWADKRLVPKVLVANQTSIIEAVCDERGEWLPAVPVVAAYPGAGSEQLTFDDLAGARAGAAPGDDDPAGLAWTIAAVLTSPVASVWLWHRNAGTGLSSGTVRVGPVVLGELPWPAGDLAGAVGRLRRGDVVGCGESVLTAYGVDAATDDGASVLRWWRTAVERIEQRIAVAPRSS